MKDITFYTVVGGSDHFYDATRLGVESIKRKVPNAKIKIFDFSNKFQHEHAETIDCSNDQDKSKKDIGYLFWREKYLKALQIDTEYAVYFDCDTVLVNDFFDDIFDLIGEQVGSAQHWWVPTFSHYYNMATPLPHREAFVKTLKSLNCDLNTDYYAGGVFMFKNTITNRQLFEEVVKCYDEFNSQYDGVIDCVTDEYFFSCVFKNNIVNLGGSLNVCPKGNGISMDLLVDEDGILVGKNVFDKDYNPVIFIHCNLYKGDPLDNNYSKEAKKIIADAYQL